MSKLGPVQFVRMSANRSTIERTRRHIRAGAPRLYSYLLQVRGSGILNHWGHEAHLSEGDFVLCDSAVPHSFTIGDNSTILMLRVEARMMREHLPTPEQYCGLRLRHDVGLGRTMSAMVEQLNMQLECGFASAAWAASGAPCARDAGDELCHRLRAAGDRLGRDARPPGGHRALCRGTSARSGTVAGQGRGGAAHVLALSAHHLRALGRKGLVLHHPPPAGGMRQADPQSELGRPYADRDCLRLGLQQRGAFHPRLP